MRPGEGHVADAEAMVGAEQGEGIGDGMAAFQAQEDGEAAFGAGGQDVFGCEAEAELARVSVDLGMDGFEEFEGASGLKEGGVLVGIDPDGEELGG